MVNGYLHVGLAVTEHWQQLLDDVLSVAASVGQTQTKDGAESHDVVVVEDIVTEQSQGRITLIPHSTVDNATCKQST